MSIIKMNLEQFMKIVERGGSYAKMIEKAEAEREKVLEETKIDLDVFVKLAKKGTNKQPSMYN